MKGLKEYIVRPEDVPVTEDPLREYKYKPIVKPKFKSKPRGKFVLPNEPSSSSMLPSASSVDAVNMIRNSRQFCLDHG